MPPGRGGDAVRRRRAAIARVALYVLIGVLLLAFFRLQVLRSSEYALRSESNRLRAVPVPAARGAIYDRNGEILAENVPGYSIALLPARSDTLRATLRRIAPHLEIDEEEQSDLLERHRRVPNRPLIVRDDATFEQVAAVEERRPEFRRAVVEMRPRRRYPAGRAAAHVLGYLGEITDTELADPAFGGYDADRLVGRSGLERRYESEMAGEPGIRYVEVNALGSIIREFGPSSGVRPEPGEDITLGLDLDLQLFADSIFPEDMRGGVVALDPRDGEVLLFYSHPTYDPNAFVGGIDAGTWRGWRDDPDQPLMNRVTGASYSPGSTWKLVMSTLALQRGQIEIDDRMDIPCRGALRYGIRSFRCWRPEGHGSLDLAGAIKNSCNVYFYQLGMRLGLDAVMEGAARLGFTDPTGIDLPHEAVGRFPESREWYDRRYGSRGWTESVSLNLAIGQGENSQSLLKMAVFYGALATGEPPVIPRLRQRDDLAGRRAEWSLELAEEPRRQVVEAMERVVNEPGGTAYPYRLERWKLAGKTGTTQNPQGEPHSWFVGFAPADDPEIVIASMVEFGHPQDQVSLAVPLASRLVQRYLEDRHPATEEPVEEEPREIPDRGPPSDGGRTVDP